MAASRSPRSAFGPLPSPYEPWRQGPPPWVSDRGEISIRDDEAYPQCVNLLGLKITYACNDDDGEERRVPTAFHSDRHESWIIIWDSRNRLYEKTIDFGNEEF